MTTPTFPFGAALAGLLATLGRKSGGARRAREAERLFALSDRELAARGLTRERVLRHAFRGALAF